MMLRHAIFVVARLDDASLTTQHPLGAPEAYQGLS